MRFELQEIASAIRALGDLDQTAASGLVRVQTDSRAIQKGDVFFCLSGQAFDGHNFAPDAVRRGAAAVVAHKPLPDITAVPVLMVRDTLVALGDLAVYARRRTSSRVIAVTGSAGKTTTKELLYAVLQTQGKTGRNYKNFNNQVGLPLSILAMDGDEEFWILELGINCPGDMDELGRICEPDVAVVINIGPCHLQGLENEKGVARAKARLADYLPKQGLCVASADHPELLQELGCRRDIQKLWFGGQGAQCRAEYAGPREGGGVYRISVQDREAEVFLPFFGRHLAESVAAAACTASALGMTENRIANGLARVRVPERRMRSMLFGERLILDDSYNANPLSMSGAIQAAKEAAGGRGLVLVLGEMGELGNKRAEKHRELGAWIEKSGCEKAYFAGPSREEVRIGIDPERRDVFQAVDSPEDFLRAWRKDAPAAAVTLFKGSRSAQMERYLQALSTELGHNPGEN
ncbi:MAG: UDP-N-acetylmuramoyl-tripeptide--D-alanyl-D-alanine ligase [Desulfonatronovibrionaceae bacterium]